jgi:hypothetical protein
MFESLPKIEMSKFIQKAIHDINGKLKESELDSKVSVIDFTHFANLQDEHYLLRFLIFGEVDYLKILDAEKEKYEDYALFKRDEIKIFCNLGNVSKTLAKEEKSSRNRTEESKISLSEPFNPKDWHDVLIKEKFGGCSIIYSRKIGKDQSAVYLILSNAIGDEANGKNFDLTKDEFKNRNILKLLNEIFIILDRVLIAELAGNLHAIWEKSELEKQKAETRHHTFEKLYHSQNEYINSVLNIASVIKNKDKELGEYLAYLGNSLGSFKDIVRYKDEGIDVIKESVSIKEIVTNLEKMFNRIFRDKQLNRKVYTNLTNDSIESIINHLAINDNSLFKIKDNVSDKLLLRAPIGMPQLILKEVISNAIKHVNVNNPIIEILYTKNKEKYEIHIVNYVMATENELRRMRNPSLNSRNGMKIIHQLCDNLNWKIRFEINPKVNSTSVIFKILINEFD